MSVESERLEGDEGCSFHDAQMKHQMKQPLYLLPSQR